MSDLADISIHYGDPTDPTAIHRGRRYHVTAGPCAGIDCTAEEDSDDPERLRQGTVQVRLDTPVQGESVWCLDRDHLQPVE